jgi:cytochrome P450
VVFGLASKIVYNLWLHPLAKYPGPLLARITDFVYWYHWLRGRLPYFIEATHEEYGSRVRIGPNRVSYIEPEAWKDISGHNTKGKTLRVIKDPGFYINSPHLKEPSLLIELDDGKHASLRKLFTHGFSDRALKAQEPLIRTHVDKMISNIRQEAASGRSVDMVKLYNCCTFDIIGELAFGESLGLLENSELNAWVESILYGLEDAAFYALVLAYPILGYFVRFFLSEEKKTASLANAQYSEDRVRKRMDKGAVTEKPDFWTLVLSQHDSGALNFEQMKSNADLFMAAGSETTATMLSGLTYNLLKNPDKLKKVVDEVRSSFAGEDELTIGNIHHLKYLNACFEESMRSESPKLVLCDYLTHFQSTPVHPSALHASSLRQAQSATMFCHSGYVWIC